jgi:hypothetical protein
MKPYRICSNEDSCIFNTGDIKNKDLNMTTNSMKQSHS